MKDRDRKISNFIHCNISSIYFQMKNFGRAEEYLKDGLLFYSAKTVIDVNIFEKIEQCDEQIGVKCDK